MMYSKTCEKQPLSKRPKTGFQDQLSLNAGQKYFRMLQYLSICEWPFYTGFTELMSLKIAFILANSTDPDEMMP